MRPIEFRAWINKSWGDHPVEMVYDFDYDPYSLCWYAHHLCLSHMTDGNGMQWLMDSPYYELMQFTGLLDKTGLTKIFEDDIIGVDGIKKGNIYENKNLFQDKTNLVIPSITSKAWQAAYIEAMGRGCRHTE